MLAIDALESPQTKWAQHIRLLCWSPNLADNNTFLPIGWHELPVNDPRSTSCAVSWYYHFNFFHHPSSPPNTFYHFNQSKSSHLPVLYSIPQKANMGKDSFSDGMFSTSNQLLCRCKQGFTRALDIRGLAA